MLLDEINDSILLQNIERRKVDLNDIQQKLFIHRIKQCDTNDKLKGLLFLTKMLNPQQFEAAIHDHDIDNQLLIIAGAGSGKTAVLTRRIVFLLLWGVSSENIFAVTFTNKAAGEMKERVKLLLEDMLDVVSEEYQEFVNSLIESVASMWISTFHSACLRILRETLPNSNVSNIERLDYSKRFTILSEHEKHQIIKDCFEIEKISDETITSDDILGKIAICKNELMYPEEYSKKANTRLDKIAARIYKIYQKKLMEKKALDFDDMIFFVAELLKDNDEVRNYYQERFEYVLIDEYQDTNFAQYVMAILLSKKYKKVFVVGDDDQSIYGWRGADIRNILNFNDDFPKAKIIKLEKNYRSTGKILKAANNVFLNKPESMRKILQVTKIDQAGKAKMGEHIIYYRAKDGIDEMQFVTFEIDYLVKKQGLKYIDCAVLYRVNEQKRYFTKFFTKSKIPFIEIGDNRSLTRPEIKDILMILDLLDVFLVYQQDSASVSKDYIEIVAEKYLNFLKWPVFRLTRDERVMLDHFKDKHKILENDDVFQKLYERLSETSKTGIMKMNEIINTLLQDYVEGARISDIINKLLELTKFYFLLQVNIEAEKRYIKKSIKNICNIADIFEDNNRFSNEYERLRLFLDDLNEKQKGTQFSEKKDGVQLLTLHSAKGLEFPVVFFIGLEEGIVPHFYDNSEDIPKKVLQKQIDEERRLFYVGITRAQERLYLIHANKRYWRGKEVMNKPSRFLKTIPKEILEKEDFTKGFLEKVQVGFGKLANFLKT